jgi:hypothetical protein
MLFPVIRTTRFLVALLLGMTMALSMSPRAKSRYPVYPSTDSSQFNKDFPHNVVPSYPYNEIPHRSAPRNDYGLVHVIPSVVEGSRLSFNRFVSIQQGFSP